MASPGRLILTIRVAWWYRALYLPAMMYLAAAVDLEPRWERFGHWTRRAITVTARWKHE